MLGLAFVFSVFPFRCYSVVSTSAIDCLERLVPEMNYYVSSRTNATHSRICGLSFLPLVGLVNTGDSSKRSKTKGLDLSFSENAAGAPCCR